ncbi:MAG TPA: hypothetical protein VN253_14745 [Kofleriaceae bacterium]|nr:hypothetical protein [Kofleriaceae bacterium]
MGPVPDRALSSPRRWRRAPAQALVALAIVALAIVAALAGCGGGGKRATAGGEGKPTVIISVSPSRTSNHGRPLHALVRAVTLKQFVEDQYANVAQLVVSPDESVLASFVVFPGLDQAITIDRPAKGGLAVYFLFTGAAGTTWKQLFDSPPSKIRLELGDDEIVRPGTKAPAGSSSSGSKKRKSQSGS